MLLAFNGLLVAANFFTEIPTFFADNHNYILQEQALKGSYFLGQVKKFITL